MKPFCQIVLLLTCTTLIASDNELLKEIDKITELPKPIKLWTDDDNGVYVERNARSRRPTLIDIVLQASAREGLDAMTELYGKIEPNIIKNGQILENNHPAALLSKFSAPAIDSEAREKAAYATISAAKAFRKNYKYFNDLARHAHNQKISLRRTALEGLCAPRDPPPCMPASERYRTHDGTCNNKNRLRWGSAQMPFNRFLPPEYGDGVDTIRNSVEGGPLSSSRFVSLLVHGARDGDAPLTLMIVQWGQLLDHDMTSTAQPRSINGSIPSCCGSTDLHPSCFPIKVPLDDPWLAPLKVRCLEFLRSAPAQRRDCMLSWREQTNQASSYIDASPIYSNSVKSSDNARTFRNGMLIFGRNSVNPADDVCHRGAIATKCIRAGDGRSGEQPGLLALHHVWVGEHNRIATELSGVNLHWSDEKVYQETRRIIGAMFQHITYREFLPIVLGREVVKLFDLEILNTGYFDGYNPKVNPTVANSFSAAAFRFGHSLVQNSYIRCDRHHNVINNNVSLHEEFQQGDIGTAGSLHRLLRGMAMQRALKRDEFITPELTNHLFQTPGFPFGLDLAAINIQRGRDHGIAPYTSWRVPCGLTPINTWDDFVKVVGPESARRIGHAYHSVHDIDLFVGGIAERPVVGGLVGPTFACIIAQQFSNSRKGDRFWYENGGFESSFTPAQLHSIRRVSLAQVLCGTLGGGTFQPHIFIPSEFSGNERQPCGIGALAPIDLSPWIEQDPFGVTTERPTVATQTSDKISDIFVEQTITRPIAQLHKEDKAGFSNRVKIVQNTTIDIIPNASVGLQIQKNFTKINDKLDFKHKITTTKRPHTLGSITGINNKLDKGTKTTSKVKGQNRRKIQTTTKRTVIINNVAIELRNAVDHDTKNNNHTAKTQIQKQTNRKQTTTTLTDKPEPRTASEQEHLDAFAVSNFSNTTALDDTKLIETAAILLTANITTTTATPEQNQDTLIDSTLEETHELTLNNTNDKLDPLNHSTAPDHTRVQRKLHVTSNITHTNTDRRKLFSYDSQLSQNASTKFLLTNLSNRISTTTTSTPRNTGKTTERSLELRQYQNRPIYTRPQKVIVNGPNADEYEIEINIRQTNKSPPSSALTTYDDYTTAYRPYDYDKYSQNFPSHTSTTPIYSYYQSTANSHTINVQIQKTKPPTIIYIDEDERTTTRAPNLLQNFLSFATSGFNNNRKPDGNKDRPDGLSSNVFSSPRPPYQVQFPFGSSSTNHIGGSGMVSSAAISSGGFNAIAGVSSANGADSIFSFNIRPRPAITHTTIVSKPSDNGGNYGFYNPPQKPTYSQSSAPDYVTIPGSFLHNENQNIVQNPHSPFSTIQQRPQASQYYFNRLHRPQQKQDTDHKLATTDYDYLSRTLEPIIDKNSDDKDSDEYQYDYDNDTPLLSSGKKFDKDGYLRPEHMTQTLFKNTNDKTTTTRHITNTTLDDNYIQPLLNDTSKLKPKQNLLTDTVTESNHLTNPTKTLSRHLINEITVDNNESSRKLIDVPKPLALATFTAIQNIKPGQKIAFAPLKVLTKPERPDNWVIFDEPFEKPLLPVVPAISSSDTSPAAEIPMPLKRISMLWLKKYLLNETDTRDIATTPAMDDSTEKLTTTEIYDPETLTESTTLSIELANKSIDILPTTTETNSEITPQPQTKY